MWDLMARDDTISSLIDDLFLCYNQDPWPTFLCYGPRHTQSFFKSFKGDFELQLLSLFSISRIILHFLKILVGLY